MNYLTHLSFGFLLFLVFKAPWLALPFVLVGAVLPDLDHPKSFINERLWFTKPIGYIARHRGLLHSALFMIIIFAVLLFLIKSYAYWILLGYFSHLLADSFNVSGIAWLAPFSKWKLKGPVVTNSYAESIFILAGWAVSVALLLR